MPLSGGTGRAACDPEAAPRAFRLLRVAPGLGIVWGAGASSYAPHGGERVAPKSNETHPPIYLHRLTETGNSRLTETGNSADLRKVTETGKRPSFLKGSITRLLCVGPMPSFASASLVDLPAISSRARRMDCGGRSDSANSIRSLCSIAARPTRPEGMHSPMILAR